MATALTHEYRVRKNFGKIKKIIDIPSLILMQKDSYDVFLQKGVPPEARESKGLQEVFRSVFPNPGLQRHGLSGVCPVQLWGRQV